MTDQCQQTKVGDSGSGICADCDTIQLHTILDSKMFNDSNCVCQKTYTEDNFTLTLGHQKNFHTTLDFADAQLYQVWLQNVQQL